MNILFSRFQSLAPSVSAPGFYSGVLVIEKGPAKGHYAVKDGKRAVPYDGGNPEHVAADKFQIHIGDEALDDVVTCGNAATSGVKCKLDHGSSVKDAIGKYSNFRREGDQVRADLTLMASTPHRDYVVELIAEMSEDIGNSIDFNPSYEVKGAVAVARCHKLNSVDIVDSPAATNSLFNEPTNQPEVYMPLSAEDLSAIANTVKTEVASQMGAIKTEFNTRFDEIKEKMDEDGGDTDKDKDKDKDKDAEEKLSATVQKATLAAVEKLFPKAKLESLLAPPAPAKGSEFETAVAAQLSAGAASRGIAIQRVSRDRPDLFNAHMGKK